MYTLKTPHKTRGIMTDRAEPFWRDSQWLNLEYLYISKSQPVEQSSPPLEGDKDFKMSRHTDRGVGVGVGVGRGQIPWTRET